VTAALQEDSATSNEGHSPRPSAGSRTAERIGLAVLLVGTAVFYLWNITVNGMANGFYAGAAQAGSKNWKALLFGSLDAHNFITVDKPPVSQWVMGLSGQIFGFSSASMLVPEALMAVATVALLYAAVRRISGPWPALVAGALLALTPVAALMFRFNNPDAVMVLLMMAAVYFAVRAVQASSATWMALAGVALGFAFLAKMLEALMVAPAIGLAYLVAAPTTMRRRLLHVAGSALACVLSSGWFVLLTLWWPAQSRPYLAGSTNDNFMNLVLGYNGFGRVLGRNHLGGDPHPANADAAHQWSGFAHQPGPGLTRLFAGEFGFEISWLLPAALVGLLFIVIARGRAPRTDLVRAAAILFGGWLVVDGLVLSYMKSMVHPYYSLSFAPAVAALVAIAGQQLWERRQSWFGRTGLAVMLLVTGVWSWWLLGRNGTWLPGLRWTILVLTVVVAVGLLITLRAPARRRLAIGVLAAAIVVGAAGSAAYSLATIGVAHSGGMPSVGPATHDHDRGGFDADNTQLNDMLKATRTDWSAAIERSSPAAALELATNTDVMAIGGFGGSDPMPSLADFQKYVANHRVTYYIHSEDKNHGGFGGNHHDDITAWVADNFTPQKVGDYTVYDLTTPRAGH
jgi:4-amino-4-deoxy-L-arabinose transferase-like glycosyltransferase